jgi:hypothetical protein
MLKIIIIRMRKKKAQLREIIRPARANIFRPANACSFGTVYAPFLAEDRYPRTVDFHKSTVVIISLLFTSI